MLFVNCNLFKGGFTRLNEITVLITFSVGFILLNSSCFVHGLFSVQAASRKRIFTVSQTYLVCYNINLFTQLFHLRYKSTGLTEFGRTVNPLLLLQNGI